MTPDEVAQKTLDNHVIRDDWNRKGYQIRDLIVEAIEIDRAERGLVVTPKPLSEGYILGLRESAAKIQFEGGTAELDHMFGFGRITLALTVNVGDAEAQQTLDLAPMVKDWVNRMRADMTPEGRPRTVSQDVTPTETEAGA